MGTTRRSNRLARAAVLATIFASFAAAAGACTATVNTDGLSGGAPTTSDASSFDATTAADASVGFDSATPTTDSALDTSNDAAVDAVATLDAEVDAGDPSLIAYWTFDEDGGTVAFDQSGHGNDGILTTGASIGGPGHEGNALHTESGGVMQVDTLTGTTFPQAGTLSFWLLLDVPDGGSSSGLFDFYDTSRYHFYLHPTGANILDFAIQQQTTGGYDLFWMGNVTPKQWTHVVFVFDIATTSQAALFIDGAIITQTSFQTQDGGVLSERFVLGGTYEAIDDVRLYNRALTNVEAAQVP